MENHEIERFVLKDRIFRLANDSSPTHIPSLFSPSFEGNRNF